MKPAALKPYRPNKALHRATYSINWSRSVVKQLIEAHARASEIVFIVLEIDSEILAKMLAMNDEAYTWVKNFIKRVDKHDFVEQEPELAIAMARVVGRSLTRTSGKVLQGRLDKRFDQLILKEQVSTVGFACGEGTPEP